MKSGAGRIFAVPALALSAVSAACVSTSYDAPPGSHSGEGSLMVEPALVAASADTRFRFTYTVGPSGIVFGGGFRVELPVDPVHPFLGFTPPHTTQPHLRGHVQCVAVRAGQAGDGAAAWIDGRVAGCQLKAGSLAPGDQLVMDYWSMAPRVAAVLPLHVESRYSSGGGGRPIAWPPVVTVGPRPARALLAVLPGVVAVDTPMTLVVVALDEFGNLATEYRGAVDVVFGSARLAHQFTQEDRGVAILAGLTAGAPGFQRAAVTEAGVPEPLRLSARSNPVRVTDGAAPAVLWGDLHFHTGTGAAGRAFMSRAGLAGDHRGNYTQSMDAYAHARDVMRLDFAAATEHATGSMTDEAWQMTQRAADSALEPGRFTTFAAFQWNDRLVLLPSSPGRLVRSDDRLTDEPAELEAALAREPDPGPLILTLATASRPDDARAVEIYSWRNRGASYDDEPGRFEPQPAWVHRGLSTPIALTAGSDNHWGRPGEDDLTGLEPGHGGLTAVEAERNDRSSILSALRQGRAWATTGARIQLRVAPDGLRLKIEAAGTAPFRRIELVVLDGARVRVLPVSDTSVLDYEGSVEVPRAGEPALCYVRAVQEDGEMAWSSLMPVDGGVH